MKKPPVKSKEQRLLEEFIHGMLDEQIDEFEITGEPVTHKSANKKPLALEENMGKAAITQREQKTTIHDPVADKFARLKADFAEDRAHAHSSSQPVSKTPPLNFDKRPPIAKASPKLKIVPEQNPDINLPVVDQRLEKVQSLLSRMPKPVETPAKQEVTPEPFVAESLIAKEQKTDLNKASDTVVESVSRSLHDADTTSHQEEVEESNLELFDEDVSREVERAREMLGNEFQTLVFDVGKLPLAVPLVKLGGIHAYSEEDITPIFGTPDWFKGLIPSEQGNVMLVDTARFIMPEKYESIKDSLDYKYAILLDDTRWALACTNVREAKSLSLDDIRWAQKGSQKEWFAGMVVQFMCALIEVDSLINLLYRTGKPQKNS